MDVQGVTIDGYHSKEIVGKITEDKHMNSENQKCRNEIFDMEENKFTIRKGNDK